MTERSEASETQEAILARLARLEAVDAVRKLQHQYGYYIDKCLYRDTVELFARDCEIYFANGVFRGRAGASRLFCDWFGGMWGSDNGPVRGVLVDHLILQDVVNVAEDGQTAFGRFRCFLQGGGHVSKTDYTSAAPRQWWESGVYENEYVLEEGIWKIRLLRYNLTYQANYENGWANDAPHIPPLTRTFPEDPLGPDALIALPTRWPETYVVPFHYPHPTTGAPWR